MNTHCPICGKEYGIFERLTQPNMCGDCFKAGAVKTGSGANVEIVIVRRSGWATFLRVIGCLNILIALIGIIIGLGDDNMPLGIAIFAGGLVAAIQSFIFAFLLDVFTDIRWFTKKLADERSHAAKPQS